MDMPMPMDTPMGPPPMGGLPGMMTPGMDNSMMPTAMGAPQFASTDPSVIAQILSMLEGLQQSDHAQLGKQQDEVLASVLMQLGILGAPDTGAGFAEGGMPMLPPEQLGAI